MRISDIFDFSIGNIAVSLGSSVLIIWGWIKLFANKRLDHEFNKRLEKHKNELEQLTNRKQFEYNLKIQDYNIYSEKKHLAYAEIYYQFCSAMESMLLLMVEKPNEDYHALGKIRVELLLKNSLNLPEEIIDEVIAKWSEEEDYIDRLNKFFWDSIINNTQRSLMKAKEVHQKYALHVDQEVEDLCFKLASAMDEWRMRYLEYILENHIQGVRKQIRTEYTTSREKAEQSLNDLREKMRSELKYGKYNDLEITKAAQ